MKKIVIFILFIFVVFLAYEYRDSIYEVYVREYLIENNIVKVNDLQKNAVKYVSAKGQYKYLMSMIESNFLTEEELTIVTRARNHKSHTSPKNTDIVTYKYSTGLEALIGYLYLSGKNNRISDIMEYIFKID